MFPELAFTTFFPRWQLAGDELDRLFRARMPNPAVQPLFDQARALGVGFYVGYAELDAGWPALQSFDPGRTATATLLGKYRKVHLPGTAEPRPGIRYQQLEKRYFEYGDLGFPAFRAPRLARCDHRHDDLQ